MIDRILLDELKLKQHIRYYDLFRALGTDTLEREEVFRVVTCLGDRPCGDRMPTLFYDSKRGADADNFLGLLNFIGTSALKTPSEMDRLLKNDFINAETVKSSLLYISHIVALVFYESEPDIISYSGVFTEVFKYLFDGFFIFNNHETDFYELIYKIHKIACEVATDCLLYALCTLIDVCKRVRDDKIMLTALRGRAESLMYFNNERIMRLVELYSEGTGMEEVIRVFKDEFGGKGLDRAFANIVVYTEYTLPLYRLRPMLLEHRIDEAYIDILCMKCTFKAGLERVEQCRAELEEEFSSDEGDYLN